MNSTINIQASHSHRILVVANETSKGAELHEAIRDRMLGPGDEVLILAPALNSRIRHWLSDIDPATRVAELRLCSCVEQLRRRGIEANGIVGDFDPLQAIEDALQTYAADELVISTHTEARSNWLAHDLVGHAQDQFGLPITHVEVDVDRRAAVVLATAA